MSVGHEPTTRRPEDERRHQARVGVRLPVSRARRWSAGAWREIQATIVDLSSRGIGLRVDQPVQVGERLSLAFALSEGDPEVRVTLELRHVRWDAQSGQSHAGGLFRALGQPEHQQVAAFVADQLRARGRA
jgi:hypothetical protein